MRSPSLVRRIALSIVAMTMVAACAEPDLGPPSSTTLLSATPTPTPSPTPEAALGPSNTEPAIDIVPTPTPTPTPEPDVGLSDTRIRIGVIADLTPGELGDDRGESAWNAMEAWERSVNDDGGLAGRRVDVVPIDSAVFFHEEALIEACEQVFAIVGSWSVNDGDALEVLLSPDCSMPDFPAVAHTPRRQKSPLTFQSNPQRPDVGQAGPAQYLVAQSPEAVASAMFPVLDFDTARMSAERLIETFTLAGFAIGERPTLDQDADLAQLAVDVAQTRTTALVWNADRERFTSLLTEMSIRGVRPPVIVCGQACYDPDWIAATGSRAEGVITWLSTIPLEEIDASFELTQYRFWLGRVRPEAIPDAVGVQAWASALLFEEAVNRATRAGTAGYSPGLLTRSAVLDAAETITSWDANGLHGEADPANGVGSPCFVLLQVADGAWQRLQPFGRGVFDCEADNLVTLDEAADLGLEDLGVDIGDSIEPLVPPTPTSDSGG